MNDSIVLHNTKKISHDLKEDSNERGSVLIIVLIILLVLTVVGFAAVRVATVDTYIAGNVKATKEAFYNAEGGLRATFSILEYLREGLDTEALVNDEDGNDGMYSSGFFPDTPYFWNEVNSNDPAADIFIETLGGVEVDVDKSTDDGILAGNFQLENRYGYHSGSGGDGLSSNMGAEYTINSVGTFGNAARKTITAEVSLIR